MKILFASDISFKRVTEYSDSAAIECMNETASVFRQSDFSMVNLENVFGDPNEFKPIKKSGPNLISSKDSIKYLDVLKPDIIGMANNHAGDFGEEALISTIDQLVNSEYKVIGAGKNIEEAYKGAVIENDGISAYIIAVCENEFGIAKTDKAGSAGYSLARITKAIFESKANGMHPIIYFHGGNEFNPFPSPQKVELYRHFIDIGASAVIAMHTHCPQGYEMYNGSPIVYSMGNFYFPNESDYKSWFFGYMTTLDISNSSIKLDIIPYSFDFNKHTVLSGEEKEEFLRYMEFISKPISDDELLQEYFDSWCMKCWYIGGIGFSNEYITADPATYAGKLNLITCEAHTDVVRNSYKVIFEQRYNEAKSKIEELKQLQEMKIPK